MKIHWQILKKPSFIIGGIVLFFLVLFLVNRSGGSSSGQTQVVNAGPDPAQVAAQLQLAGMQISAGVQGQAIAADISKAQDQDQTAIALATIQAASTAQQTSAQAAIAAQTVAAQVHGLDLQYQTAVANNNFALNYAAEQFNYGLANTAINANLQSHLADVQAASFNLGQELSHVTDVRLHGGQRLAVLQNIINTNGAFTNSGTTNVTVNPIPVSNTTAGTLA